MKCLGQEAGLSNVAERVKTLYVSGKGWETHCESISDLIEVRVNTFSDMNFWVVVKDTRDVVN